ncbi:MAG: hypothetical protein ACYTEL_10950 [Planctomycetota bacterium]
MKRDGILLVSLLLFLSSCGRKLPQVRHTWTGQEEIRPLVPACIIWHKQVPPPIDAWKPYKSFSQADAEQMREIILLLVTPENRQANADLKTEDKLSLIFYNGFPEKLTVRQVYFKIQDETFTGPLGQSAKLAKILLDKQEVRPTFYYPYTELGAVHYLDSFPRIQKSLEFRQKQIEERKAEREAEAQKRVGEANKPE